VLTFTILTKHPGNLNKLIQLNPILVQILGPIGAVMKTYLHRTFFCLGVMHAYEIEYVFGVPTYNLTAGYTNREKVLSSKMMQFWTSFAATGYFKINEQLLKFCIFSVPSLRINKETEEWPKYHPTKNRRWMHLKGGSHIKPIPAAKERECRVWRAEKEMDYHKYCKFQKLINKN
jgi:carboxylesterase type B